MKLLDRVPLRALLTIPFVVLMLALAAVAAGLSYRAAREAVDTWSDQLLIETVERIKQAANAHVSGSAAVLEAAFPNGVAAPVDIGAEMSALRTRFWLATSVHRDPNYYIYYGDLAGRFVGLLRHSEQEAELRLRLKGEGPRSIYRFSGINGQLGAPAVEQRIFDPRERPWFKAGQENRTHIWTSIYLDFRSQELVATRARRVNGSSGEFEGVVATDLSLVKVSSFLRRLALSSRGVAMVMEANGDLIGVSRGALVQQAQAGTAQRLSARESSDALVAATYRAVAPLLSRALDDRHSRTTVFSLPDGQQVQVGFSRLSDDAGLDWLVMVAVPRDDFVGGVERSYQQNLALGLLAALVVCALGVGVLHIIVRELGRVARAARRMGEGDWSEPLVNSRTDELGLLVSTFNEMQSRLLTDPLTGLANRVAVLRQIEERTLQRRRRGDSRPFVLLFVDFNRFKDVNDLHGHDVGDRVLVEMAQRLRQAMRAQDMVARYAGDEFLVLLESVQSRSDAEQLRAHLEQLMREPLQALQQLQPPVENGGATVGMAVYPENGQDAETLIKAADTDMYRRKPDSREPTA